MNEIIKQTRFVSLFSSWLPDYFFSIILIAITCMNITKAYLFIAPIYGTHGLLFWARGSVKREYALHIEFIVELSMSLFLLSIILLIFIVIRNIVWIYKKQRDVNLLIIQLMAYPCLFVIVFLVFLFSGGFAVP